MEAANNANTPTPQVVGNVFVEQYYHILHTSPELVYRFYQDRSVISRPDINEEMTIVTTMKGINEKIMSLNFKEYKAKIKTADAQKSFMEGVTVLVTGCLTDKQNIKRKFAQSFFLAPQDNGYFVLNDVFRYVDDVEQSESENTPKSEVSESEVSDVPVSDRTVSVEVEKNVEEVEGVQAENEIGCFNESAVENAPIEDDAPKKSYASIVKVPKGVADKMKVYVPAKASQASPTLEAEVTVPSSSTEEPDEDKESCHSIYIKNLPFSVSVEQLEEKFSKFGPIKHDGVQVRFNKGYCFGFIEFLTEEAMNKAIEASPLTIDDRQAIIEVKRAPARVGSEKGRLPSGRQGFRNDSFRGRGSYTARAFTRNETTGRFGGQGEGYFHQGRGRGSRPSGPRQNPYTP